jgi:hypothetical protein
MAITSRKTGLRQEVLPNLVRTELKSNSAGIVDHGTGDGTLIVRHGETVLLAGGYAGGGTAGSVYRRVGVTASVNVGTQNYTTTSAWTLMGTNAAFIATSEANRDLIEAIPDAASINTRNVVRTNNP